MLIKFTFLILIICIILGNAKPVLKNRSTLSDNPTEVFESISTAKPNEQSNEQSADPDVEAIIAETETRVNAIINHGSYY